MLRSLILPSLLLASTATAQPATDAFSRFFQPEVIPVTVDNFVRAATDIEIEKYMEIVGDVNTFLHYRQPIPIDHQVTIRSNLDTLYSMAIVDLSEGATLTVPDVGDRYLSFMVINQDHYVNKVFHGGGTYQLDLDTFDTPYVVLLARTLVNSQDPEDVAAVNAIQDQMKIEAGSSKPFFAPNYDEGQFAHMLQAALELARSVPDSSHGFGAKEDVDLIRHLLFTASGWGGLPEEEAFYLNVDPGLPVGEYVIDVPADVPVGAFWSISLYNADGFFEKNPLNAYSVNSVMGDKAEDGSTKVHLGGCDDGRANCLPIMDGWNYAVRLYRPAPEILNGSWTFPPVRPVE